MKIKEAYKVMQAECGIEVGDRVDILRPNDSNEMGTSALYHRQDEFDCYGSSGRVDAVGYRCIVVITDAGKIFRLPFFVLRVTKKAHKPEPEKMVDVDGKDYSLSTLKLMIDAYNK